VAICGAGRLSKATQSRVMTRLQAFGGQISQMRDTATYPSTRSRKPLVLAVSLVVERLRQIWASARGHLGHSCARTVGQISGQQSHPRKPNVSLRCQAPKALGCALGYHYWWRTGYRILS
jgi:hypothetical protein